MLLIVKGKKKKKMQKVALKLKKMYFSLNKNRKINTMLNVSKKIRIMYIWHKSHNCSEKGDNELIDFTITILINISWTE